MKAVSRTILFSNSIGTIVLFADVNVLLVHAHVVSNPNIVIGIKPFPVVYLYIVLSWRLIFAERKWLVYIIVW